VNVPVWKGWFVFCALAWLAVWPGFSHEYFSVWPPVFPIRQRQQLELRIQRLSHDSSSCTASAELFDQGSDAPEGIAALARASRSLAWKETA